MEVLFNSDPVFFNFIGKVLSIELKFHHLLCSLILKYCTLKLESSEHVLPVHDWPSVSWRISFIFSDSIDGCCLFSLDQLYKLKINNNTILSYKHQLFKGLLNSYIRDSGASCFILITWLLFLLRNRPHVLNNSAFWGP